MNFSLDSDESAGTNIENAEVIDAFFRKNDSSIDDTPKEMMSSLWKDAGGGGTREGMEN